MQTQTRVRRFVSPTVITASALAALTVAALGAVLLGAVATGNGAASSARPDGGVHDVGDGGAAPPPLPRAAPTIAFDPATSIANHDGSVVAVLDGSALHFAEGRPDAVTDTIDVGEDQSLRALSTNGRWAALFRGRAGAGPGAEITIVDRYSDDEPTVYRFPRRVEPEAFATDGSLLFVIDHEAGGEPGSYRVRPLDVATGRLDDILGPDKLPLDEEMNGNGRRQVWSSDGRRLYTLYIRQAHTHDHGYGHDHDRRRGEADRPGTDGFVHVLDLEDEWAFCLDLPSEFGAGTLRRTALAVSPVGDELAVIDLDTDRMALASTDELTVTDVVDLPPGFDGIETATGAVHLGLFPGHVAVTDDDAIRWFDRPDLAPGPIEPVQGPTLGVTTFDSTLLVWPRRADQHPRQLTVPPSQ